MTASGKSWVHDVVYGFYVLAVIGFGASAIIHAVTFGGIDLLEHIPVLLLLHVLIFAVWIPGILRARKAQRQNLATLGQQLGRSPGWLQALVVLLFVYMFLNFLLCLVLLEFAVPDEMGGKKVLHSHGKIVRELSDGEYRRCKARQTRLFTGHWMFFYAAGMILLYAHPRKDEDPCPPPVPSSRQ